jgi:hypothetical protein
MSDQPLVNLDAAVAPAHPHLLRRVIPKLGPERLEQALLLADGSLAWRPIPTVVE